MDSKQINEAIRSLEDSEQFNVIELEGTGKCIPYIGWYWRDVDFDSPHGISLGILPRIDDPMEGTKGWIGFIENNKWGYDEFLIKGEEQKKLKSLVEAAVTDPDSGKLQGLFTYIQTLKTSEVEI